MKVLVLECNAEELRANRTLMDCVVDTVAGALQQFMTSEQLKSDSEQDEDEEDEDEEDCDDD